MTKDLYTYHPLPSKHSIMADPGPIRLSIDPDLNLQTPTSVAVFDGETLIFKDVESMQAMISNGVLRRYNGEI